jgi:hypothetical protein
VTGAIESTHVQWDGLVTVALLGTDRRDPPLDDGPIGDVVADAMEPSPAERMLTQVAAAAAVRRAAFVPGEPASPLAPAPVDDRPVCPPPVTQRWRHVVSSWPVLEDEWLLTVIERGWRVDPEIVPALLSRHRTDAMRRTHAVLAIGPLAGWLTDHVDALRPGSAPSSPARAIGMLPALPIPPDLAALMAADGERLGEALVDALATGAIGGAHRNVLINAIARVDDDRLGPIARHLGDVSVTSPTHALAAAMADLARTRRAMRQEFAVTAPR